MSAAGTRLVQEHPDHWWQVALGCVLDDLRGLNREIRHVSTESVRPVDGRITLSRGRVSRRQHDNPAHRDGSPPEGGERRAIELQALRTTWKIEGRYRDSLRQPQFERRRVRRVQRRHPHHATAEIGSGHVGVRRIVVGIEQRHDLIVGHRCARERLGKREVLGAEHDRVPRRQVLHFFGNDPYVLRFGAEAWLDHFQRLGIGGQVDEQAARNGAQSERRIERHPEAKRARRAILGRCTARRGKPQDQEKRSESGTSR